MSFWDDDETVERKRQERERDARERDERERAQRERERKRQDRQTVRRQEARLERERLEAEDKRVIDELVQKILSKADANREKTHSSLPTLNRGFKADRETPSHETFQYLKTPEGAKGSSPGQPQGAQGPQPGLQRSTVDKALPPLKRPL